MTLALDRVDSAPIIGGDFDPQFLQWLWVLIDTLNEIFNDLENAINLFTSLNVAILTETVTLTSASPNFSVVNGTLYNVGDNVVGTGLPINATIISIVANTITLSVDATGSGSHALNFIPVSGKIGNGIFLYDTTNNVYVGMQNGALVKFTTTAYP